MICVGDFPCWISNAPNSAGNPPGLNGGTGSEVTTLASLAKFNDTDHCTCRSWIGATDASTSMPRVRSVPALKNSVSMPADGASVRSSSRSETFF